jgi:hypothetical protein
MISEMTPGEIKQMATTLQCWEDIKREVWHYLLQGSDCFTVYSGPFTLTFNKKEVRDAD